MREKGKRLTELGGFLSAMLIRRMSSYKTYAVAKLLSETECVAEEHFDTGKGHSEAFYCTMTPVEMPVFEEALRRTFIGPKPELGYMSKREFVLTQNSFLLDQIYAIVDEWEEENYWKDRSAYEIDHGQGYGTYVKLKGFPAAAVPDDLRQANLKMILPALPLVVSSGEADGACHLAYTVPKEKAFGAISDGSRNLLARLEELGFLRMNEEKICFLFRENEVDEFAGTFTRRAAPSA